MSDLVNKQFDFLSWLTGLVVMGYVGVSAWALTQDSITYKDFSAAVGPVAGLLLGYWVRGANGQPAS